MVFGLPDLSARRRMIRQELPESMPSFKKNEVKTIKIAVIADAHANLPALEAVLDDILREDCEKIYHLGDAIAIGAYSSEVLELMLQYDVKLIMGNHEAYFLAQPEVKQENMSDGEFAHQKWVAGTMGRLHRRAIKNCVFRHDEIINGYSLAFMHYALNSDLSSEKKFTPFIKDLNHNNIDDVFGEDEADIIFFGHLHKVVDISGISGKRYINPGALGCQKDDNADYCIVSISNGTYEVIHRKVKYDKSRAIAELDNREVPEREFIKKTFYGII